MAREVSTNGRKKVTTIEREFSKISAIVELVLIIATLGNAFLNSLLTIKISHSYSSNCRFHSFIPKFSTRTILSLL